MELHEWLMVLNIGTGLVAIYIALRLVLKKRYKYLAPLIFLLLSASFYLLTLATDLGREIINPLGAGLRLWGLVTWIGIMREER